MKPARIAVFLQLCLLAAIAAAQTPEQEIEAEAKKLFSTLFSKCGEDYFSKRTFRRKVSTAWVIGQYKDLAVQSRPVALSKADSLNGIQWKGSITFTASAGRVFPHATDVPKYSKEARTLDVWSEWKGPDLNSYAYYTITKRNGVVDITRKPPMEIAPVKCNEIPQG